MSKRTKTAGGECTMCLSFFFFFMYMYLRVSSGLRCKLSVSFVRIEQCVVMGVIWVTATSLSLLVHSSYPCGHPKKISHGLFD